MLFHKKQEPKALNLCRALSMIWSYQVSLGFLYDNGLRHERVKEVSINPSLVVLESCRIKIWIFIWIFHLPSYNHVVIKLGIWEPLILNLDPWNFGGHKICGRGDTHINSRDTKVTKEPYVLMGENPSPPVTTLPIWMVKGFVKNEMERFWFLK